MNKFVEKLSEKSVIAIIFTITIYILILIRTAWLTDDALITLRTVRNFLDGYGLVWNLGERVQVYTHPLWMLVLSATISLTHEYFYSVIFLSIFISLITIIIVVVYHAPTWPSAVLAILLLTLSKSYGDYSTSGLENPLTHLLLALFYLVYFHKKQTPRMLFFASLLAALGMTNRTDIGVIYLPALLYSFWNIRSWRSLLAILSGFTPLLMWESFAIFYYGFPFPNTAYAKLNTNIPWVDTATQGALYILSCVSADPMLGFVIITASALVLFKSEWRAKWMVFGILCYLMYIIRIGGDYTLGRFLSAPFFCAVIYLTRFALDRWWMSSSILAITLTIGVGLMPLQQSPLFVDGNISKASPDNKGVADERKMLLSYSLLETNRFNRFYESGITEGWTSEPVIIEGAIGRIGFTAHRYKHIIDEIGLADPLLARLPSRYYPKWRAGHPVRHIPEGYLLTHQIKKNRLKDAELAQYYDKLQLIISGDLFDYNRLKTIWQFNWGHYDDWIDTDRYHFSSRRTIPNTDIRRSITSTVNLPSPISLNSHGILIEWPEPIHQSHLEIGINLDRFMLVYYSEDEKLIEQRVNKGPVRLHDTFYHILDVPDQAIKQGYTAIHLYPRIHKTNEHRGYAKELTHNEYILTYLESFGMSKENLHPQKLLELYYHEYLQGDPRSRERNLENLFTLLHNVEPYQWSQVNIDLLFAFLKIPDPALHTALYQLLPQSTTLTNADGRNILQYLGYTAQPTLPDAENTGVNIELYLNPLADIDESYSAWFFIRLVDSDEKWMHYDSFPTETTDTWQEGEFYRLSTFLKLKPGVYDITFGFWTATRERLYIDAEKDIYWLEPAQQTIPAEK